jgi:aminopeptidase N
MRTASFLFCLWVLASPAAADGPPLGRLPKGATPLAYRLDLTVVPDRERFTGHVEIDVSLAAPTTSVYLHGRGLAVRSAMAVQGTRRLAATYAEVDPLGTAQLTLAEPAAAGPVTLLFDYDAPFGEGAAGLYRARVADDWYVWSQFEAIEARAAFPSFDEPGFKTPFTVRVTTAPGLMVVANAPETGEPVAAAELVTHTFAPTKPLPTYLVAFAVGPFASVSGVAPPNAIRTTPLPLRIVATKNQAGKLAYALAETPRIIELLEQYFGTPFPFPKLDQIASPMMSGAMENAGADIYLDWLLLLDANASVNQKQYFGMVVAHELSHQWFGDLVTPAWWDDLWLNESFANWMGFRIGSAWRPELNIASNAAVDALSAMDTDALQVGRPIRQAIATNGEIDSAFDGITYGKGGQVIAMVADYLGDERFREGVRLHLSRHPYGSATSEDFFAALADGAKDPRVLAAMQGFVNQQGVPVVDLVRQGSGYVATVSRYTPVPTAPASASRWIVPMCVRRGETRSCTLVERPGQPIETNGAGVLVPNAGAKGYYRYSLSAADWNALIDLGATLPAGEALAAIDSLWAQFRTGRVTAAQLMRAARTFGDNPDANVVTEFGWRMGIWRMHGGIAPDARPSYEAFLRSLYGPRLAAVGFDPRVGAHAQDPPDRQKLRVDLLRFIALEARDRTVRSRLSEAASAFLRGEAAALDTALYGIALQAHAQDGDLTTTQALFERALSTEDDSVRGASLEAAAGSLRQADADWVLAHLDDKRLRQPETLQILNILMLFPETRDQAFAWLGTHFDALTKDTGVFTASAVASLPKHFCSADKAAEIDRVYRPRVRRAGRGELAFDRMLEGIRVCEATISGKAGEVSAALR